MRLRTHLSDARFRASTSLWCVAFGPARLFGLGESTLFVWDRESGELLRRIDTPHNSGGTRPRLAVRPDGGAVCATSSSTWHLELDGELRHLETVGRNSLASRWSPDGRRLVVTSSRATHVLDAVTLEELGRDEPEANDLTFGAGGRTLATQGRDLQIRSAAGSVVASLTLPTAPRHVALGTDVVAIGLEPPQTWNWRTGAVHTLPASWRGSVAVAPDDVVAVVQYSAVNLAAPDGTILSDYTAPAPAFDLALSDDGQRLAVAAGSGVALWDLPKRAVIWMRGRRAVGVHIDQHGVWGNDSWRHVCRWNDDDVEILAKGAAVGHVAFGGGRFAYNSVRPYHGQMVCTKRVHTGPDEPWAHRVPFEVEHLAMAPDGAFCVIGENYGEIHRLDLDRRSLAGLLGEVASVCLLEDEDLDIAAIAVSDDHRIAVGCGYDGLFVIDREGVELWRGEHRVKAMAFHPDGRLAVVGPDGLTLLGSEGRVLEQRPGAAIAVAWRADVLVTSDPFGVLAVYEVARNSQ